MITNETQLAVAQRRLDSYRQMLETTRRHLQETNSALFPSVSEGYLRHIEELQDEIATYLREHPAESALSVRLSGPTLKLGIIRATLVGSLISGFQSALYQVGRLTASEGTEGEIRKIEGIRSLLGLNLVATAPGSFVLAMDFEPRQEPELFDEYDVASSAIKQLIHYVNELQKDPQDYTGDLPTLRSLQKVSTLVRRNVETIEVVYRNEQHRAEAVFDPVVRERIEYLLGAPKENEKTVRGTLIAINIENNTCKVHPAGEAPIDVDYEESLEDDLVAGIKQEIEMAGQFIETTRPGRIKITKIERFRILAAEDADLE